MLVLVHIEIIKSSLLLFLFPKIERCGFSSKSSSSNHHHKIIIIVFVIIQFHDIQEFIKYTHVYTPILCRTLLHKVILKLKTYLLIRKLNLIISGTKDSSAYTHHSRAFFDRNFVIIGHPH